MQANPLLPSAYFLIPGMRIAIPQPPPPSPPSPPPPSQSICGESVTAQFGDTIWRIAERCGVTVEAIMQANPLLPSPHFLIPGMRIAIPEPPPPPEPEPEPTNTYVVQPGDTLRSIARALDVRLIDLYRLNPGVDWRNLRVGQILNVPAPAEPPPPEPPADAEFYVVQAGDTLYAIARAHGLTLGEIFDLNPGIDPQALRVGQVIRVGGVAPPQPEPPAPQPAEVRLEPASGAPGTIVTLSASGFQSFVELKVSAGSDVSSLQEFERVTSDSGGSASLNVRIPDWAAETGMLVFAVETLNGRVRVLSETFNVTTPSAPGRVTVTGTLTREGAECQAMRGDDGRLYTLIGNLPQGLRAGDRVSVVGRIQEMSYCQQGTTLHVRSLVELN